MIQAMYYTFLTQMTRMTMLDLKGWSIIGLSMIDLWYIYLRYVILLYHHDGI